MSCVYLTLAPRGAIPVAEMQWPRKIQSRKGEHALIPVEGQTFGGQGGEQRAEVGRRRQYLKRKKNIF